MRNQHDAVARQHLDQGFPYEFSIGVSKSFVSDFPRLSVRRAKSVASGVEVRAPADKNGCRRHRWIDLSRSGCQFERGIVDRAISMHDVSKNARHYFNPP